MATPNGCPDGDYRAECWDDPAPGTGTGNQCPEGSGTHWDPATGTCVPDSGGKKGGPQDCAALGLVPNAIGDCVQKKSGVTSGGPGNDDYTGYQLPAFGGNFKLNSGNPPAFKAPKFAYGDFVPPNPEDIYKDPSYQWRLDQGRKALESSAAAKGTLRSGGTLAGILQYGQNYGAQEYGNVFDRARDTYTTNRTTALDVFDRLYQGAKDEYAPTLLGWQTNVENSRIANQRAWEDYWRRIDDQWRRENAVLNAGSA